MIRWPRDKSRARKILRPPRLRDPLPRNSNGRRPRRHDTQPRPLRVGRPCAVQPVRPFYPRSFVRFPARIRWSALRSSWRTASFRTRTRDTPTASWSSGYRTAPQCRTLCTFHHVRPPHPRLTRCRRTATVVLAAQRTWPATDGCSSPCLWTANIPDTRPDWRVLRLVGHLRASRPMSLDWTIAKPSKE